MLGNRFAVVNIRDRISPIQWILQITFAVQLNSEFNNSRGDLNAIRDTIDAEYRDVTGRREIIIVIPFRDVP